MNDRLSFILAMAVTLSSATRLAADGNVRAFVDSSGTLIVVGDDADNRVVVGRIGGGGAFVVMGEVFTTINGTNEEVVLSADDVKIFMGAGNDEARVDGFVPGFVHVEGGTGNDRLSLGDPVVHGTARLDGGEGDDHLGVEGTDAAAGLRLIGGNGDDEVHLLSAAVVRERLVIELGAGDDVVLFFHHVIEGFLRIDAGIGADTVTMQESTVTQDAVLVLGAGNDEVVMEQNGFGGRLKIALGTQNDALTIGGTEVVGAAAFYGTAGTDAYTDLGGNVFQAGEPTIAGFETFLP